MLSATSSEGFSLATLIAAQGTPLLWVVDTAPVFLGLFAWLGGRRQDRLVAVLDNLAESNRELERANHQLTRASQLKSQFLANMSHELRTPLNSIIGFSRILIRKLGTDIPERQAKNLRMVHESGQHLLELVNDILDIERIEAGMVTIRLVETEVISLALDVVTKMRPAAQEKSLELNAELPDRELVMTTDPVRLRQILDNLVHNAVKYSDTGTITLEVVVGPSDAPGRVQFIVRDEGIGIPTDALSTIFDAFRQVDGSATRAQGGVGLGLHLVRRIASLLDGDVQAVSTVGEGSVFTFSLPAALIVQAAVSVRPVPLPLTPEGNGPVILIIDDKEEVIEINRAELVDAGYRVHAALDGEAGLEKAAEIRPDVILLDIVMPEMDGWAVLRELRRNTELCSTPVIITSMLADVPRAYEIGIRGWLTKPVSQNAFRRVFEDIGLEATQDVLVVEDD
ncbi:MAG: response regulator, partial [Deltaproteobacteria bacterium]|nr:response regulator [Deltaproteobacteria bacterium]